MNLFGTEISRGLLSVSILLGGLLTYGQAISQANVWDSYSEKIKAGSQIAALGPNIFGDSVDPYTGRTSFVQEDILLPGNNELPVRFARTYSPESLIRNGILGDWYPDIPHISGTFPTSIGWQSSMPGEPNRRCSVDTADYMKATPPVAYGTNNNGLGAFSSAEYWTGSDLYIPGVGSQRLVVIAAGNSNRPTDGGPYYWTTAKNYVVSCVGSTANGIAGEGFVVISPSGIKYRFDWLARVASQSTMTLKKPITQCTVPNPDCYSELARGEYWWLPTRVEDRFGNYVTYVYDSLNPERIVSIQSNDGRTISFVYDASGRIASANANGRTWTYTYASGSFTYGSILDQVNLPDGSSWSFDLGSVQRSLGVGSLHSDCTGPPAPGSFGASSNGSMTSPSGAVGSFTFVQWRHGRSYVPRSCVTVPLGGTYSAYSQVIDTISLAKKSLQGPGINGPAEWTYSYEDGRLMGPSGWSYADACTSSGCPTTKVTTVTANDGTWTSYTLIKKYGAQEGLISSTAIGSNQTQTQLVTQAYVAADSQSWFPASVGRDPCHRCDHTGESYSVTSGTTISQDGSTFQRSVTQFDSFARPTAVTRSGPSGSRSDAISYFDNAAKWVLGQIAQFKCTAPTSALPIGCGSSGTAEREVTYDTAYALPLTYSSFGKLRQTLTYDTASAVSTGQRGTVKTIKDGNNNVSTMAAWKRGIPQSIVYADSASASAEVNDDGWITSVTDENGYKTSYTYDAMGRLDSVVYPTGDSTAWNTVTQVFEPVANAEYGIPAGHWRQTISTGNARRITYYDALWRPLVVREFDTVNETATKRFRRFAHDHEGRTTFISYPGTTDSLSTGTWNEYDALGRVTSVSQDSELGVLTTLTEYLSGFKTRTTDPKGNLTTTSYLAYDQPSMDWPVLIAHPEGAYTHITRDPFGKPTQIRRSDSSSPSGGTVFLNRAYAYSSNQELCRVMEPETGATLMGYDGAGNLKWSAAGLPNGQACEANGTSSAVASRRVDRSYDARNRLETLLFPDGQGDQVWTYTLDGLPSQVTTYNVSGGDAVVNSYTYNRRRLPTGESIVQPGRTARSIGYGYDANGALASHAYPSGLSVVYAPNALGQPTMAGTYATGVSYYPNGAIKQFTYGNGIVHTMTQNARQLPARSLDCAVAGCTAAADKRLDLSYDFDANANVYQIVDGVNGRQTRGMNYDGLDRLVQTTSNMFGTANYAYDALNNLTQVNVGGGSKARNHYYCYDASVRLSNVRTGSCAGSTVVGLEYDAQGNLSNKNGQTYAFDYGNRLRQATGQESYRYDAHGRRVYSHASSGDIYSQYGQDGVLRSQDNLRTAKNTDYVYLGGSLVARVSNIVTPAVPTLGGPSYNTSGSYTVSWNAVATATSYQLQESANGGSWTEIYNGTGASQVVTGKSAGVYSYRVRSCLNSVCGNWSATLQVSVQLAPTAAPSLTAPAIAASGNYTVGWTTVAGAESYTLEESANGGAWTPAYTGTATSKVYSGKAVGSYGYRVKACNAAGCGPMSATKTVQAVDAPAIPAAPTVPATNSTGSYTVSWSTVATATTYELEEQVGSTWTQIQASSTTSKAISGKATGTYGYRLRACNAGGCSAYSPTASVQVTLPPTGVPDISAPLSNTTGGYTVSWTSVSGATTYQLEEGANGGAWTQIQATNALSKTITGKASGSYSYRVRACSSAGCGGYSGTFTVGVTLPPTDQPALTVPSTNTSGSYTASWTAVTGAASYQLEESANGGNWTQIYNGTAISKAITGKTPGSYGYRARGCSAGGCGPYSPTATTVVAVPVPASPSNITAHYLVTQYPPINTTFKVTWVSVSGATYYEVKRIMGTASATVYSGSLSQYIYSQSGGPTAVGGVMPQFQVRACNASGCSAWSAAVTPSG